MAAMHRSRPLVPRARSARRPTRHRIVLGALATATLGLAIVPAPSLAATGSVYVDANHNVGAGHDFFGGGTSPGSNNVGVGYSVMPTLTVGIDNTAIGDRALSANANGVGNVASGAGALLDNLGGDANTATGSFALGSNTAGDHNVASGSEALFNNTTGNDNVADGYFALRGNFAGHDNVAIGRSALASNSGGYDNVAVGANALVLNDGSGRLTGHQNVAVGFEALSANRIGVEDTALGDQALAANTGNSNLALGSGAGQNLTTGSDNVDIANTGKAGESNAIRIGTKGTQKKAFLAGVSGRSISGTTQPVLINGQGQLGTATAASTLNGSTEPGTARRLKHQESQIRRQTNEIATLKREVARLSRG